MAHLGLVDVCVQGPTTSSLPPRPREVPEEPRTQSPRTSVRCDGRDMSAEQPNPSLGQVLTVDPTEGQYGTPVAIGDGHVPPPRLARFDLHCEGHGATLAQRLPGVNKYPDTFPAYGDLISNVSREPCYHGGMTTTPVMSTPTVDDLAAIGRLKKLARTGGARIYREEAGVSLRALARTLGVDASLLCHWENGVHFPRSPERALAWAEALRRLGASV